MELEQLQKHALELSDADRAALAAELLDSLPATVWEEDDGIAEAERRARELDEDPSLACSWEDIKLSLGR